MAEVDWIDQARCPSSAQWVVPPHATRPLRHSQHLRPCRQRDHIYTTRREISLTHKFLVSGCRIYDGSLWTGGWILHWDCRGCWGQRDGSAAEIIYRHDADAYLCGGSGNLWNCSWDHVGQPSAGQCY
ncbi:hypothetical protein GLAREA_04787 [Glarea lozoyensis ATCC 20868]|uniref:Uncharacterized protein n=1 Tax=Glarea lozoyensis (strain ATCC 20868 / MF5171) TaxID=1116229 RepID=S3D7K7_GLAL2|nr:uncharacterized protein GLAREA_04787 [Glarea lozoyensis ATCC 20868]EPE27996.1 hypothetical protein GLAREA_04787 [Glarea lozoyensis ATCC 20868]